MPHSNLLAALCMFKSFSFFLPRQEGKKTWLPLKSIYCENTDLAFRQRERKPHLVVYKIKVLLLFVKRHGCPAFVSGEGCYLVLGDLGEDVHHRFQAGVDESLLQLLVLGSSVAHFVVLPLLEPLVVCEGDQTQRGLSWSREKTQLSDKTLLSS